MRHNNLMNLAWLLATLVLAGANYSHASEHSKAVTADDPLPGAFAAFVEQMKSVDESIRQFPAYGSEAERVGAYRNIFRSTVKAIEADIIQDADYPYFRIIDFWIREGGDNPDQLYSFSPVRGGEAYRIWGKLGSAKRVEVQLYAGEPWDGTGRSAGFMPYEEIELAADGSFEIFVTPKQKSGNWMDNPDDTTTVFVRHIYDQWDESETGQVHIDRLGYEGRRKQTDSADKLAERIKAATKTLEKTAVGWPYFVNQQYVQSAAPRNTLSPLVDTYSLGGVKGRWMGNGYFELPQGKALIVKSWPTKAAYQAIQLTDMWFASMEYGNRVSSLNTTQSLLSPDGAYYYVISATDPGHANWLDAESLHRGVILMRYDGVLGEIPQQLHPSTELVDLAELAEKIPGYKPVTERQREKVRAERRHHLQLRSGR